MKRSLKSIICEFMCYVTAFSPLIAGGVTAGVSLPFAFKDREELKTIQSDMKSLLDEIKNNDEFIEIKNQKINEATIKWNNQEIDDLKLHKEIATAQSDEFVLEYAISAYPEIFEEYNKLDSQNATVSIRTLSDLVAFVVGVSAMGLGQVVMFAGGDQKKWINKGKKIAGKKIIEKETDREKVVREYCEDEIYSSVVQLINQNNENKVKNNSTEKQPGDE